MTLNYRRMPKRSIKNY